GGPDDREMKKQIRDSKAAAAAAAARTGKAVSGLGTWFGHRAEVDLRVGGQAKLIWNSGDTATLTIERLEPPRVFGYTWGIYGLPEGDPRRTYVEFALEPASTGTTLTMVESRGTAAG